MLSYFPFKTNRVCDIENTPPPYSLANTLKPFRIVESLLGLSRYYPPRRRAAIIQMVWAAMVIAAMFTQSFNGLHVGFFTSINDSLLVQIIAWLCLIECVGYIFVASFWCRSKYVSLLDAISIIDERLNLDKDKRFFDIISFRSNAALIGTSLLHPLIVVLKSLLGNVNIFSIQLTGEFIRSLEFVHSCLIVRAVNSRLHLFNRHLKRYASQPKLCGASSGIWHWKEYWDEDRYLETINCGRIDFEDLMKTYNEIIECSKMVNSIINKAAIGFIAAMVMSGFITSYLLMTDFFIKKKIYFHVNGIVYTLYWAFALYRYVSYPCQLCYYAQRSILIHRETLLILHNRICVSSIDKKERQLLKVLATVVARNPLQYSVGRLFALDMSAPLKLFSILSTYIIILIQFKRIA